MKRSSPALLAIAALLVTAAACTTQVIELYPQDASPVSSDGSAGSRDAEPADAVALDSSFADAAGADATPIDAAQPDAGPSCVCRLRCRVDNTECALVDRTSTCNLSVCLVVGTPAPCRIDSDCPTTSTLWFCASAADQSTPCP